MTTSSPLRQKITLTVVKEIAPETFIWDTELRGFAIRRQKGTAVTYMVRAQVKGKRRYFIVGHHGQATPDGGTWAPDTARKQALKILGNPTIAEKAKPDTSLTFKEVAAFFETKHGAKIKASTLDEYKTLLKLHLIPAFGAKKLTAITRADVSTFHAGMSETPRAANHALSVLSKLFTWSVDEGYMPEGAANPCQRVQRYKEAKRERFLTADELARLGAALDKAEAEGLTGPYIIAAVRLLIFTGCRLSEILTLLWTNVDLERRMLFLDDSKTGKKAVTLNDAAVDVLMRLPKFHNNPHVIVGHRLQSHLVNLHKPWGDIRKLAGLDKVRLHDLRHTFASVSVAGWTTVHNQRMEELGLPYRIDHRRLEKQRAEALAAGKADLALDLEREPQIYLGKARHADDARYPIFKERLERNRGILTRNKQRAFERKEHLDAAVARADTDAYHEARQHASARKSWEPFAVTDMRSSRPEFPVSPHLAEATLRGIIRDATSWGQLTTDLAARGLRLEFTEKGLAITDGLHDMPLSFLGKDHAVQALNTRYGQTWVTFAQQLTPGALEHLQQTHDRPMPTSMLGELREAIRRERADAAAMALARTHGYPWHADHAPRPGTPSILDVLKPLSADPAPRRSVFSVTAKDIAFALFRFGFTNLRELGATLDGIDYEQACHRADRENRPRPPPPVAPKPPKLPTPAADRLKRLRKAATVPHRLYLQRLQTLNAFEDRYVRRTHQLRRPTRLPGRRRMQPPPPQ